MTNKKKLVTADDYRIDRDKWKRIALAEQRKKKRLYRHIDRVENDRRATNHALEHTRQLLQEICPHDKLNYEKFTWTDTPYCERCKVFVNDYSNS